MNIFNEMQRVIRVHRGNINRLDKSRQDKIAKLERHKGSTYYEEEVKSINDKYQSDRNRAIKDAKQKLNGLIDAAKTNIDNRYTKEPTSGMVNTLMLMNMRQNIMPSEIEVCINKFGDCYQAKQVLIEKAESLGYRIYNDPTLDDMRHALEVVAANAITFLEYYDGEESAKKTPTLIQLERYYQAENEYSQKYTDVTSSAESDARFWSDIVGYGHPGMFDRDDTHDKNISVQYYFADLDGLLDYIKKQTEGMDISEKADKVNEILSNCPAGYGAIYRHYLATGHKMPLLEDLKRPSEREPNEDGDSITE